MKKALSLLAVVAFFLAARFAVQSTDNSQQRAAFQDELAQTMDSIRDEARNLPDRSENDAVREVSTRRANELLQATSSAAEARNAAAGTFMGFYLVNKRTRYDYCAQQQVDISPFVSELTNLNRRSYKAARQTLSILSDSGEDTFYQELAPELVPLINDMMQSNATELSVTTKELCELFRDNPEVVVADLNFSVILPDVYEALNN